MKKENFKTLDGLIEEHGINFVAKSKSGIMFFVCASPPKSTEIPGYYTEDSAYCSNEVGKPLRDLPVWKFERRDPEPPEPELVIGPEHVMRRVEYRCGVVGSILGYSKYEERAVKTDRPNNVYTNGRTDPSYKFPWDIVKILD